MDSLMTRLGSLLLKVDFFGVLHLNETIVLFIVHFIFGTMELMCICNKGSSLKRLRTYEPLNFTRDIINLS